MSATGRERLPAALCRDNVPPTRQRPTRREWYRGGSTAARGAGVVVALVVSFVSIKSGLDAGRHHLARHKTPGFIVRIACVHDRFQLVLGRHKGGAHAGIIGANWQGFQHDHLNQYCGGRKPPAVLGHMAV